MIPREIEKLILLLINDIRAGDEEYKDQFRKDPEAFLALLLNTIRKELPDVSAMLAFSVRHAFDDDKLKMTRRQLDRRNNPKKKRILVSR